MNSDVIKLLPDSVANQIAAGEVIQRPASVIKELVENAVDAGATNIQIILKDAGRTLIQVIDDGCGMSPADARMAFERHATSKISDATDLYRLHTMGFRGEALPSVAAVAQIDLRTMRHGDSVGTRLLLSESKFESQEPCPCVPGTNLMVKNIFFHMPARRKFLKKDSVELNHIMREFERLALVNTSIDFTLIHNDVTLHQFQRSTFKQRIGALFGKSIESHIAAISTETSIVKISGFIGIPAYAKKRGAQQFFFVNGRNMRHPYFHKAVLSCYDHLISPDSQPSYFINFEVDPATIDVNIHPQKHEIKFEHEQAIWQILIASIRESLGKIHAAGALDFDMSDAPDIPLFNPEETPETPKIDIDAGYDPFKTTPSPVPGFTRRESSANGSGHAGNYSPGAGRQHPVHDWEKLYENFSRERDNSLAGVRGSAMNDIQDETPGSVKEGSGVTDTLFENGTAPAVHTSCMQIGGAYIATPSRSGLLLIDQNRAHIRIQYDRIIETLSSGASLTSQQVMFPESMTLSPAQNSMLSSIEDLMPTLGFAISYLGDSTWAINGYPNFLGGSSPVQALTDIIETASAEGEVPDRQEILKPLALSMARSSAIRHGYSLSATEMETIVADLFRTSGPDHTPDGLPVIATVTVEDIASILAKE